MLLECATRKYHELYVFQDPGICLEVDVNLGLYLGLNLCKIIIFIQVSRKVKNII